MSRSSIPMEDSTLQPGKFSNWLVSLKIQFSRIQQNQSLRQPSKNIHVCYFLAQRDVIDASIDCKTRIPKSSRNESLPGKPGEENETIL